MEYKRIFEANKEWVENQKAEDPLFFEKLSMDQTPEYLYIGCSDSRVHANEIMGVQPGQVFVHRNIGNLVVNTDLNVLSVINFAVEVLHVKYIIVCGHYDCGAVKAAMKPKDLGILNPWLRNIRDVYRLHEKELDNILSLEDMNKRLVEMNVYEQCLNVLKTAEVQKAYHETGYPIVAGWIFDLKNGLLKDLEIDYKRELTHIQKIYDLTSDLK